MPAPTQAQIRQAGSLLARATSRLDGAAAAATRSDPSAGEFDNSFDGTVTAIFHVVDAFELLAYGRKREMREAEQPTRIRSVVLALEQDRIANVPLALRLVDLNRRRNTSVHGEWSEVLDTDSLLGAIDAGRALVLAVRSWAVAHGLEV